MSKRATPAQSAAVSAAASAMARKRWAGMTAAERTEHNREMANRRWAKAKKKPKAA